MVPDLGEGGGDVGVEVVPPQTELLSPHPRNIVLSMSAKRWGGASFHTKKSREKIKFPFFVVVSVGKRSRMIPRNPSVKNPF